MLIFHQAESRPFRYDFPIKTNDSQGSVALRSLEFTHFQLNILFTNRSPMVNFYGQFHLSAQWQEVLGARGILHVVEVVHGLQSIGGCGSQQLDRLVLVNVRDQCIIST